MKGAAAGSFWREESLGHLQMLRRNQPSAHVNTYSGKQGPICT